MCIIRWTSYFGARINYFKENGDLTCEIDRHPAPANDDDWFLQSRVGTDGDWSDEEDVIPSGQIEIGSHYRCLFRDTDGEDSFSHILRIVDGKSRMSNH